jgi:hypothetical protein
VVLAIAFAVVMAVEDRRNKAINGGPRPKKDAMEVWEDLHRRAP